MSPAHPDSSGGQGSAGNGASAADRNAGRRRALAATLHPRGIPPLWCPTITHYREDGTPDIARIAAHLDVVLPAAPCILVPGSTGDGWEMGSDETETLLRAVLPLVLRVGGRVLVGALHPDPAEARKAILRRMDILRTIPGVRANPGTAEGGNPDPELAAWICAAAGSAGFAVCAPSGAGLSGAAIESGLRSILELGVPTALYQLPQVTKNEIPPGVVERLAGDYPWFYLFKDTSGTDQVAKSGIDRQGVFFVRGAEGDFARWLSTSSGLRSGSGTAAREGLYDGFLLSSANSFPAELAELVRLVRLPDPAEAKRLSDRISAAVRDAFAAASGLPYGNPFSNANRALDHVRAYGEKGFAAAPRPRTHCGVRLPAAFLREAAAALGRGGFVSPGYLRDGPDRDTGS